MKAQEYLEQIHRLDIQIRQKKEELDRIQQDAYGLRGMTYDRDQVQTSPTDKMPDMVIRCMKMEREVQADVMRKIKLRHKILDQIQHLSRPESIMILNLKYVKYMKPDQICGRMNISIASYYNYLNAAHREFEQKFLRGRK